MAEKPAGRKRKAEEPKSQVPPPAKVQAVSPSPAKRMARGKSKSAAGKGASLLNKVSTPVKRAARSTKAAAPSKKTATPAKRVTRARR